jgi:hypothetical protein
MRPTLTAALALVLALGACGSVGQSRLNPMNWFAKRSVETLAPSGGWGNQTDRRALVPAVTEIEMIRTPEGAVLHATALMATQGWWDVELRALNDERPVEDALIYEFVAAAPITPAPSGSEASRLVTAGVKISNARLEGVRRVVVRGAQNAREVRR